MFSLQLRTFCDCFHIPSSGDFASKGCYNGRMGMNRLCIGQTRKVETQLSKCQCVFILVLERKYAR